MGDFAPVLADKLTDQAIKTTLREFGTRLHPNRFPRDWHRAQATPDAAQLIRRLEPEGRSTPQALFTNAGDPELIPHVWIGFTADSAGDRKVTGQRRLPAARRVQLRLGKTGLISLRILDGCHTGTAD